MKDFKNIELKVGDKVIFVYDKYKRNELKEGEILRTDIKQGIYTMALVSWENPQGVIVESRVSTPKIYLK